MYTEPYLRLWNSNVACITHQTDIEYRVNADPVLSICLMGYTLGYTRCFGGEATTGRIYDDSRKGGTRTL
jgi:hypothetical protein